MISPNESDASPQFSPNQLDKIEGWREKDWAINTYTCLAGHMTTTVDVDEGTTPFLTMCPKCKGAAQSALYPQDRPYPFVYPEITHEWYRMNSNKVDTMDKNSKYHHENGGLFMRKRTKKVPIKNSY